MSYTKSHIREDSNFQHVQRAFGSLYPFLKIVSFSPFNRAEPSPGAETVSSSKEVPVVGGSDPLSSINIGGLRTVAEVVKDIREVLGLSVIIQRKFGNLWIGTFLTADWTLEQQNREGENISRIG